MSHLKGIATIQLFDAKTGELQQEVKEENMITNAVEECLNLPDYIATGLDINEESSHRVVSYRNPIADNFFNGVLIYRDPIEENAEKVMPPFDNPEIGHAGDLTSAVLDHQGTYNTVESGAIENGIRRVWDFATDRANGKISCVCLTSRAGGTLGEWRQQNYQMGGNAFTSSRSDDDGNTTLYIKKDSKGNFSSQLKNMQIFYMERQENGEIRLLAKGLDQNITEIILGDPFKQKLFSYSNEIQSVRTVFTAGTTSTIWYDWYNEGGGPFSNGYHGEDCYAEALKKNITEKSLYPYFSPYVYQNKIHIIYPLCNKGGANALRHIILNLQTYAVEQDKTVMLERAPYLKVNQSYNDSSSSNPPAHRETLEDGKQVWVYPHRVYTSWSEDNYYHGIFYFDNHYFYADANGCVVAANNDGTLFQQISTNSLYLTGIYIDEKNLYVLFGDVRNYYRAAVWLLKKIDNKYQLFWHTLSSNYDNHNAFSSSYRMAAPMKIKEKSAPLYAYGFTSYDSYNYFNIYFGYLYTFMSTINNLSTPVTKTNGQTMKITYDIIQVED